MKSTLSHIVATCALFLITSIHVFAASGDLDVTFGTDGKVITDFSSGIDSGKGMAIQADGKILVAGYASNGTDNDFAVARYNANGSLDATFGTGGKVITNLRSDDQAD